jgi:hypothetical protein
MEEHNRPDVEAIAAQLEATERAHGAYETTELNGEYDHEWAAWYARHAVDQGIGTLLGRDLGADELAAELSEGFAAFEATDPPPPAGWAAFIAARLAAGR